MDPRFGAIPIPSYSSSSYPSKSSTGLPMFLGDGAYDPNSGDELWRSSQIVNTATAGTGSAIAAVVGKTILVTSPETRTISGLDIESGRQLWQTPWQDGVLGSKRCDRWRPLRLQRLHRHARDPGSRRKDDVVGPPSAGGRSARSRRLECRQKRVVLLAKSLHRLAIGRQHHRFSVVLTSRLSNQQMDRRTALDGHNPVWRCLFNFVGTISNNCMYLRDSDFGKIRPDLRRRGAYESHRLRYLIQSNHKGSQREWTLDPLFAVGTK